MKEMHLRRAAIIFALTSTIYWVAVQGLWSIVYLSPLGETKEVPYWLSAIVSVTPPMIYAAITLWFCYWIARYVARQLGNKEKD